MIDPQQSATPAIPVPVSLSRLLVVLPRPIPAPGAHDLIDGVPADRKAEVTNAALVPIDRIRRLAKDVTRSETRESATRADRQTWSRCLFSLHGLDPAIATPLSSVEVNPSVLPVDRCIAMKTLPRCEQQQEYTFQFGYRIRRVGTGDMCWPLVVGRVSETGKDGGRTRVPGVNLDIADPRER